jgi:uncharacterized membrane protein HdeD (DUF308 family)
VWTQVGSAGRKAPEGQRAQRIAGAMTAQEQLDPYRNGGRARRWSIARAISRTIGILAGGAAGFSGFAYYILRCFDTCPSDPAEDTISQILTLSLMGLGVAVIVAAVTLGTRWTLPGTWIVTALGALMAVGGVVSLALVPSLRVPANRTDTVMLSIVDLAVGAGLILFTRWARHRRTDPAPRA